MVLAEVLNDNSISAYALALFTTIIGGVVATIVGIYKARQETREARQAAIQAKKNTDNVANGFAANIDGKLTRIFDMTQKTDDKVDSLDTAVRTHLQWHLENEKGH
jgi:hypothetical protein